MSIGLAASPRATPRQGQRERLGSFIPGFLGDGSQGGYSYSSQPARTRLPWPMQAARDLPQLGPQFHEKTWTPEPRFRLPRRSLQQQHPPQDMPPMLESTAFMALGHEGLHQVRKAETLQRETRVHQDRTPRETRVDQGSHMTPRRGARQNRSILASDPNPFEHEKVDDGNMTKITISPYNAAAVAKEMKLTSKLYNFIRTSNAEGCANLFTSIVSRDEYYGSSMEK
eukprot:TRINITY_DN23124_c0_g1_i1.p1 TRINITY_DN23124_c0_g1~~TRINITY_DN23124_c0_g1_i1.p1  ORF type:complete len:227 (-),score=29.50 TRINITY_DN23124_c0_g1_i1:338-1018(-)